MRQKRKANSKRKPALDLHLRIFDEHDRTLLSFIDHDRKKNERSIQQQVRFMLRRAANLEEANG